MTGQLARGGIWAVLDKDHATLPREVILDTDGEQTADYTFETSPEISARFDPGKSSTGNVKMVLLQRWVEIDQTTGEPEETRWGDRGWFLVVSAVDEDSFERIALVNMEYEHFEAMDVQGEKLMLV